MIAFWDFSIREVVPVERPGSAVLRPHAPARAVLVVPAMRLFMLALLVTGCEEDLVAMLPDAAGPDGSCLTVPAPSTVPATITVAGRIQQIAPGSPSSPLAGVLYEVVRAADDVVLASALTDANGMWTIELATGGQPQEVYTRWSKAGFVTFMQSFATPLTRDRTFDDGLETPDAYAGYYPPDLQADANLGALYVSAVDCAGHPLSPLESPSFDPPPARLVPDSPPSGAWGLNITPGTIRVDARYGGAPLRTSIARVPAGGCGFLELQP